MSRAHIFQSLAAVLFFSCIMTERPRAFADPSDEKKPPSRPPTLEDVFEGSAGGQIFARVKNGATPGTSELISIAISAQAKYNFYLSVARQACEKIAPAGRIRALAPTTETIVIPNSPPGYDTYSIYKYTTLYCKNPKQYPEWTSVCGKDKHPIDLLDASPIVGEWDADHPRAGHSFNYAYEYSFRTDEDMLEQANTWGEIVRTCRQAGGALQSLGATSVTYSTNISGVNRPVTETILAINCCVADGTNPNEPIS